MKINKNRRFYSEDAIKSAVEKKISLISNLNTNENSIVKMTLYGIANKKDDNTIQEFDLISIDYIN